MANQKIKAGYLQAFISITLNIILFIIKYIAGIRSGSIAIIADAWHTLSDSFSSLILLFGFKLSSKPADKEHPFGHGRAELLASIVVGIILAIVGFNFLAEAIERLKHQQSASFGTFAFIVTIISIVSKEIMARYAIHFGKKYSSPLLLADGWHHRSDALSSLIVLVGILLGRYLWWIDGVLGIIMAVLIFYTSYDILKTPFGKLLGEEASDEMLCSIIELIKSYITIPINLHHLHIHNYGDHQEITFHIKLDPDMKLSEAHSIADSIEKLLRDEMNIEATIHLEPCYDKPDID
jgi:cation diffusion facilitator family transporter